MPGTKRWLLGMVSVFQPCPQLPVNGPLLSPLATPSTVKRDRDSDLFLNLDVPCLPTTQGAVPMMSSPVTSSSACYLTQCVMVLPTVLMAVMRPTVVPCSQVWAPPAPGDKEGCLQASDPASGWVPQFWPSLKPAW